MIFLVIIVMGNVLSQIKNIDEEERLVLTNILQYTTGGGFGVPATTTQLYNPQNDMFYTGLVPRVVQILKEQQLSYQINDMRVKPTKANANFKIQKPFALRDYQQTITNNASTREIIQAATGAGKTFIMANLIAKYNVKPVLVIAPKVSLAVQIKEEFEKFLGVRVCLLGGGHNITFGDIIVSTPQSCPPNVIDKANMILFDESHNIPSNTIFSIASRAKNAYYRFGVSATPWRDDGADLAIEAVLNIRKPNLSIIASDLINKGKLTPCTINFIQMSKQISWQGSYAKTYDYVITNNTERNNKIASLALELYNKKKTQLILIKKISHGQKILNKLKNVIPYEEMLDYNVEANKWYTIGSIEFLSGEDDLHRRNAILQAVRNGFCKILIASTIADEGLDLPILDSLILAGAGKSSTRAFQRIGRVLRLYKNKKEAIVYDFLDNNPTFYKQALLRKTLYETEPLWKINII